ncbi:MAG: hypothetical protein KJ645_06230, partial [Planctomycetes bacterium]|nr:hypothetical protein [Planctomycetota bacterium]
MTPRIGVFICDCKGMISDRVDTAQIEEQAATLEGVSFVDRMDLLCSENDLGAAVKKLKDQGCDRMLFVGCSPRSSLKFPEERIASIMHGLGLHPEL